MLRRGVGQRGVVLGLVRDVLGGGLRHRQPHRARVVEHHRVAVHDLERLHRVAADVAAHRVLTDPLDMGLRPDRVAGRTAPGHVGVADAESLGGAVMSAGGRDGGHRHVADADHHRSAGLRALDVNGARHLVPAAQGWRDHRPPAARRGVGDDRAAVLDRAEHRLRRVEHAVGEAFDDDAAARRRSLWHVLGHPVSPPVVQRIAVRGVT